ncbi:hypothetical protein HBI71_036820 [Parastagonospora nodorum]|nr:hypothetical protein HBI71_036820 [Parastagonospora nodorum]
MLSFLHPLVLLAVTAQTVLSSRFEWHRCDCEIPGEGQQATVELMTTTFTQQDGKEASVSGNVECNTIGARPDGCALWLLLEHCVDTGICGVGQICYNQEVVQSDKFKVNGNEYKKNDYTNYDIDLEGTGACESHCANYGYTFEANRAIAKYGRVVEGFAQPTACS